jgi:hypothetical protein
MLCLMIHYLVFENNAGPMRQFLDGWAPRLAQHLKIVPYERLLAGQERLPQEQGTTIFSNLGTVARLEPEHRNILCDLHDRLAEMHGPARVLNDPARSLRRFELLRRLYDVGLNAFNVHRASDRDVRPRPPAFIRHEGRNPFDRPEIARNPQQYMALLHGTRWQSGTLRDVMSIEFCDTADARGIYRKYGAFVVGDRIVPRHIFFSRSWHIRVADLTGPEFAAEELEYLQSNPHADTLREVARTAGVGYGRIDYGLLDGRPQVWEINFNPGLVTNTPAAMAGRGDVLAKFVETFTDAMLAIDAEAPVP